MEYQIWLNSNENSAVVFESEHYKLITCSERCYLSLFTLPELESDTYRIEIIIPEGKLSIQSVEFTLVRIDEDFTKHMMGVRTILAILTLVAFVAYSAALQFKQLRQGATI